MSETKGLFINFAMNMSDFIDQLKASLNRPLPGLSAHKNYAPEGREINPQLIATEDYRHSAVAVICTLYSDSPSFILTKRMPYDGAHGGQISFPGGKKEIEDPTSEHTARRETFEEIGWKLDEQHLLGKISDVYIPVSKFKVEPYIYHVDEIQEFQLNEREVSEIIQLPVDVLLHENATKLVNITISSGMILKDVPAFIFEEHIIWGATALMLGEIKAMLLQAH